MPDKTDKELFEAAKKIKFSEYLRLCESGEMDLNPLFDPESGEKEYPEADYVGVYESKVGDYYWYTKPGKFRIDIEEALHEQWDKIQDYPIGGATDLLDDKLFDIELLKKMVHLWNEAQPDVLWTVSDSIAIVFDGWDDDDE